MSPSFLHDRRGEGGRKTYISRALKPEPVADNTPRHSIVDTRTPVLHNSVRSTLKE